MHRLYVLGDKKSVGRKVNPKIIRIGINKTWQSKWFASGKEYVSSLREDTVLRRSLFKDLVAAGLDRIEIERSSNKIAVNIFAARPGVVIGRGGAGVEELKSKIHSKYLKKFKIGEISLNVSEVDRPNLSANIVMQQIIGDLEKRMPFRRVMKQSMSRVERAGALGVKVAVKGRLNGAEIARGEKLTVGKVPLHTLRSDIDYARGAARTVYGAIGVKVWIYRGDVFNK